MISRYAWREKGRREPGALTVSTRCSNKLYVLHLYTRTRTEMMASDTSRFFSGEDSQPGSRTSKQVLLMRELYRVATSPKLRWPSASACRHQT